MGARLFTCALTRPNEPAGFFTFGYIDTELVGSVTPVYTPASSVHGYWEFASEFAEINGQRVDRTGNTAYADTGTTLIMIADDLLPLIYGPIGGFFDDYYQGWIFPSNVLVSDIPTIVLPAGNGVVTLNQIDLVTPIAQNETYFYGSIQSRGDTTYDVFGDYWLRNIYAIWDFGTTSEGLRFGFVPRAA
jgi:Eukaryotic aspartyl protease